MTRQNTAEIGSWVILSAALVAAILAHARNARDRAASRATVAARDRTRMLR